ncbi:hypothetical protein BJY00DRAFT_214602 [Aspergillus carlsbadensis]|nr:hypothetical protein BJY00DRAFT_214602 [Aspergillus carlsbadensis]
MSEINRRNHFLTGCGRGDPARIVRQRLSVLLIKSNGSTAGCSCTGDCRAWACPLKGRLRHLLGSESCHCQIGDDKAHILKAPPSSCMLCPSESARGCCPSSFLLSQRSSSWLTGCKTWLFFFLATSVGELVLLSADEQEAYLLLCFQASLTCIVLCFCRMAADGPR